MSIPRAAASSLQVTSCSTNTTTAKSPAFPRKPLCRSPTYARKWRHSAVRRMWRTTWRASAARLPSLVSWAMTTTAKACWKNFTREASPAKVSSRPTVRPRRNSVSSAGISRCSGSTLKNLRPSPETMLPVFWITSSKSSKKAWTASLFPTTAKASVRKKTARPSSLPARRTTCLSSSTRKGRTG